jgi:heterogeneous nuclear ribonucleoprotein F/H
MVCLKIRGMPYRATVEEIQDFFRDYKFIEGSIIYGYGSDGRKNGFGALVFESEEQATSAMEALQKQNIGSRWVQLSPMSYKDYLGFNKAQSRGSGGDRGSGGGGGGEDVKLSDHVNDGNKDKTLVMRGLPWKVTMEEIVEFFDGYTLKDSDIVIETKDGRRTGSGLVVFESEDLAQEAKDALNKQTIGAAQRYVDLFDCNDGFMKRVCGLYDD